MNSDLKELQDNLNTRFDDMASRVDGLEMKLTTKIEEAVRGLRGHIEDVDAHLSAKIDGVDKKVDDLGRRVGVLKRAVEDGRPPKTRRA